jgi:hypothetical protein
MIGPDGVEVTLLYHVCYTYRLKGELQFGDAVVRRKTPIEGEIALSEIRKAIKNYLESKKHEVLEESPVFTQTPVMLGYEATKDGKPYIPPLER